jgi:hypothetical protein
VKPHEVLSLFKSVISENMNQELCQPFTDEDISVALFQIGSLKVPGLDGFPAHFFQRN